MQTHTDVSDYEESIEIISKLYRQFAGKNSPIFYKLYNVKCYCEDRRDELQKETLTDTASIVTKFSILQKLRNFLCAS